MSRISIEQWRMFVTVVDCGGFAQAGDALYKTQSTVSHSIRKLENTLGKSLFDISGRKAVLTSFGASLLDSARALISQADTLESDAISQKQKIQQTISIAIDTLQPRPEIYQALNKFIDAFPNYNIQLYETVLSRCSELLEDGTVDIGIASVMPKGYLTKMALTVDLQAVANKRHPLAEREHIELYELEQYRQIVVRDAGMRNNMNSGWLGTNNRVTVSTMHEAYIAVQENIGFAWLPTWYVSQNNVTSNSQLTTLCLNSGQIRTVALQCGVRPTVVGEPWVDAFIELLTQ